MKLIIIGQTKESVSGSGIINNLFAEEFKKYVDEVEYYGYTRKEFNPPDADYYLLTDFDSKDVKGIKKFVTTKKFSTYFHSIPSYIYAPLTITLIPAYDNIVSIINNSDNVIFNSVLSKNIYFNNLYIGIKTTQDNYYIIPPYFDKSKFFDKGETRLRAGLYTGDIARARNIETVIRICNYDKLHTLYLVGPNEEKEEDDYINELISFGKKNNVQVNYLGVKTHAEMNDVYNRFTDFIYYPHIYDAFSLKTVEALCAGMKVNVDRLRVGYYSANYNIDKLIHSHESVVEIVMKEIQDIEFKRGQTNE